MLPNQSALQILDAHLNSFQGSAADGAVLLNYQPFSTGSLGGLDDGGDILHAVTNGAELEGGLSGILAVVRAVSLDQR